MIANAAPWSMALKEAYMRDFGEDSLWEVYGSTELGVDTVLAPPDHRRKPGSCGRAVPLNSYGEDRIASRRLVAAMMSRFRRRTMSATRSRPPAAASSTIVFSS